MKINYPAVIVAAIIHFMLGGLWYGPLTACLICGAILAVWKPRAAAQAAPETA